MMTVMNSEPRPADREVLTGLIERVTYHDRAHVGMAAEHVDAERRAVHRIVGAQPMVERIWIGKQRRRRRIE